MGIFLKKIRVHGFRGLDNIELDFEPTTVIVGANNAGKTTLLKALQLALSSSLSVTDDDFFFSDDTIRKKIIIDLLFISVNSEGQQINEFEDEWYTVFTEDRIGLDGTSQFMAFRTIIEENNLRKTFKKKQFHIDEWYDFYSDDYGNWYDRDYTADFSFYFDEIPFFYLDANRDILEDLKSKTSYLGKILSSIEYDVNDRKEIESLIENLNKTAIEKSDILTDLHKTLEELDTAMDNPNNSVDITPFTKKLRDLNKGIKINYSHFAMEYHGMGTRSWSSLLILKAFILQNKKLADKGKVAYYPIIAIEEPESHLHPNAQKKLYSQINNIDGQKIISTHSSYIAGNAKLKEVRGIFKKNVNVLIGKIEKGLNSEDIRKIKRQVINTRGELYFSKAIIFCEGETEEQSLPLLIEKKFNRSIIELGINIVGIGGGGNYFPFIYFAEKLNITWFILSDGEDSIVKKLKKDYKRLIHSPLPKEDIQLPENIVYYDNEDNFESLLLKSGYTEEIETCLKMILEVDDLDELIANKNGTSKGRIKTETICDECHQNIFIEDIRNYSGEQGRNSALLDLLTQNKTRYPSILSNILCESEKELPHKMNELFEKINEILNPLVV